METQLDLAYTFAVALAAALVVALAVVAFLRRPAAPPPGSDAERLRALEAEVAGLREAKADAERKLAAEERTAARVPELERECAAALSAADALREGKSKAERDLATASEALGQTRASLEEARARVSSLEAEAKVAEGRLEAAKSEKAKSEESLAAKVEAVERLEAVSIDLRQRLEAADRERAETSAKLESSARQVADLDAAVREKAALLAEKVDALEAVRRELEGAKAAHEAARKDAEALRARVSAMQETLEQERRQADEKLALLNGARESMAKEFKVLAEEVMARHGESFTKQNKEQVETVLAPLREKLAEFQQGLQAAHTESAKDRATLAEQIRHLSDQSAKMSAETHNLTKALKGKAQTQGAWGELILETILERSGLREGEEYVTQESVTSEDGARLRPDVVVNLPNGQRIVVDSKVSLTAFEAYVNADSDAERSAHLAKHLLSMRTHIRTLAGKEYQTVSGSGLDYVIMFVPIEGALAAALQEDPALTGFAAESNVAIATPTTLMIALRTVANVWQVERRNRNAEAIAARAGALYDKFHGFATDMQKLGNQIGTVRGTYDEAMKKLSTGSGNLVRQAEMLKAMGAKTSKALPAALLEDASPDLPSLPEHAEAEG